MIPIDRYMIFARFLPVAIVALPIAVTMTSWAPLPTEWAKWLTGTVGFSFIIYIAAHISRERGKRLEQQLWKSWGGAPSRTMLRHRDPSFDPVTKARFHARLIELNAVPVMPTREEEERDPQAADIVYAAASQWLVTNTRNDTKTFSRVFEENIGYGFRRNLFGMKTWGLVAASVGIACAIVGLFFGRIAGIEMLSSVLVAAYLLSTITETSLRTQAESYARRLIEAIDAFPSKAASSSRENASKARNMSSRAS
jgi:hypothetical protein